MTFEEKGYTVRFASPEDSPAFVKWATENPMIDARDIADSMKENNPTCVTIVVEKQGVPLLFVPFFCAFVVSYLGINPERNDPRERIESLEVMKRAMIGFGQLKREIQGVRQIHTFSSADQPVAKWAMKHGFNEEHRTTFRFGQADDNLSDSKQN